MSFSQGPVCSTCALSATSSYRNRLAVFAQNEGIQTQECCPIAFGKLGANVAPKQQSEESPIYRHCLLIPNRGKELKAGQTGWRQDEERQWRHASERWSKMVYRHQNPCSANTKQTPATDDAQQNAPDPASLQQPPPRGRTCSPLAQAPAVDQARRNCEGCLDLPTTLTHSLMAGHFILFFIIKLGHDYFKQLKKQAGNVMGLQFLLPLYRSPSPSWAFSRIHVYSTQTVERNVTGILMRNHIQILITYDFFLRHGVLLYSKWR